MKKFVLALTGGTVAMGLVLGSAVGASAASVQYGAKDCIWPTHAFVESTTKGTPTHSIISGNGRGFVSTKAYSADWKRYYTNSEDEDLQWAMVEGYSSLQSGGLGCSI